ncbi:MAG: hypothetical protein RLY87_2307 [Chloroflexota bacterium]|jgi:hypothetical protein
MIDFNSKTVFKLSPIKASDVLPTIESFFVPGEQVMQAFKTIRDQVVFTNKRVIAANVQGFTGKKVDYTTIPYSKIQTFSVETAGVLDLDCEVELYISAVGKVRFEIRGGFDIVALNRVLSEYVL